MSETSETEGHLYGLMEIAEKQQAAVQAALDGLAAERVALQQERARLALEVRALGRDTRVAVRSAVRESFAAAATDGVAAVRTETQPLLGQLGTVTEGATQAEAALKRLVQWASGRVLGRLVAAIGLVIVLGWVANMVVLWRDAGTIGQLQAQKAQLEVAVAELQARHEDWIRQGMLGKMERCGPRDRPCIRVDEGAGRFGESGDYRVILGY
jgi:hypothetical protein